eukprot:CAMPEP_0119270716 /NCGR_PEP_ID=MMETSP1329-20130426/7610_1 /TAXON_ID=114041 /ORGANISM="Genus nov. species nov., Strain RCC1024" /LENGTH=211 /DNA_ID=CAMNT_0007270747 /DNA_START=125 /DNA_END=757 /DNA_ORIENTATION=+
MLHFLLLLELFEPSRALTRPGVARAPRRRHPLRLRAAEVDDARPLSGVEVPRSDYQDSVDRSIALFTRDLEAVDSESDRSASLPSPEVAALAAAGAFGAVAACTGYPLFVVASAALTAAVGAYEESRSAAAMASALEVSGLATAAAAEAEEILAAAERVKSILPVCVVLGATAASFSLLAPRFFEVLKLEKPGFAEASRAPAYDLPELPAP